MDCLSPHFLMPCCLQVPVSPSVWYAHYVLPLCSTCFKKCCYLWWKSEALLYISGKKPCQRVSADDLVGAEKAELLVKSFPMLPVCGPYHLLHETFPIWVYFEEGTASSILPLFLRYGEQDGERRGWISVILAQNCQISTSCSWLSAAWKKISKKNRQICVLVKEIFQTSHSSIKVREESSVVWWA